MLRSIWNYIAHLQPWKQASILTASLLSLGYSFKEIVAFVKRMYHDWRERRRDQELIAYLFREREATPPEHDKYNQQLTSHYRSTIQAATALGRSSVETRHRLCRLEQLQRVDRLGPKADLWTVTTLEMHDVNQRRKK